MNGEHSIGIPRIASSWSIRIENPNTHEHIVTVDCTGKLTYGPNYRPDEAAKVFWEAVSLAAPCHDHGAKA